MELMLLSLKDSIESLKDKLELMQYMKSIEPNSDSNKGFVDACEEISKMLHENFFRKKFWKKIETNL